MSTDDVLKAVYRDADAPLKKMRKEGYVPGTVYGKDFESVNIMVGKNTLSRFFSNSGQVFEVEVEGHGKHLVTIDQLQRGHTGTDYIHFSFHKISAKEKTTVTLPIHFTGTAHGSSEGGVVHAVMHEVDVTGLPKDFPESIEVDVTELSMNGHWTLKDIKPPKGITWAHDEESNVVTCHAPRMSVVEETVEETTVEATAEDMTPVEDTEKSAA